MKNMDPSSQLTIKEALSQANKATRQGETAAAMELYNYVLQRLPNHLVAKKYLRKLQKGLSHEQVENLSQSQINTLLHLFHSGQVIKAEQVCRELLKSYPQSLIAINILGITLQRQGKLQEAVSSYDKAILLKPDYADAYSNRGLALQALGELDKAVASYDRAIRLMPDHAASYSNRGLALHELGQWDEAVASYDKAIQFKPDYAEAYSNRALALQQLGLLDDAIANYDKAIELNPAYAEAYSNLGFVQKELGELDEAVVSYDKAIEINPDYADAHYNRGVVLQELGRLDEAVVSYDKAIEFKSDYDVAYCNRGIVLQELGQLGEALAGFDQVIQFKPDHVEAHSNRGNALQALGRYGEAEVSYRKALAIKPDYAITHTNLLFGMNYNARYPQDYLLKEACSWELGCVSEGDRAAARERHFDRLPLSGRRLRVGYVSGDFRRHAVSYFVEQVFANHDVSLVEVFAYSSRRTYDDVSKRIASLAEHWVPVAGLTDEGLLAQIDADKIDVLIDLSGHTGHGRLGMFALRAAPVQAHWLGYFATTGLTEMDYWIGDPIITPEKTDYHFKEEVWRLPRIWVSYDSKGEAPDSCWQPAEDGVLWLGSFNNLGKLTSDTISLWSKILHNMPEARLLLKTKELREERNCQRILDAFKAHGVGPERVELQDGSITPDWRSHMAYYDRLDIALDSINTVCGGTTTCDALWMGVPVVGLAGDRMVSRMTASMLDALGRSEWLAESEDGYVTKVMALARDVEGRKAMRSSQRTQMAASPLCDAKGLAQALA